MTVLRAVAAAAVLLGAVSETARADVQPTGNTQEAGFQSGAPGAVIAAEPVAPPSDPFVAPPAENDESPGGSAQFVEGDARSGQAYVTPTAFLAPKGTGSIDAWFPVIPVGGVLMATYTLHDRIEVGAGALLAFDESEDGGAAGALSIKVQALRSKRAALSVKLHHFSIPDEEDSLTTLTAVGSTCLGPDCRTVASVHLTGVPTQATSDSGDYGDALLVVGGGSIVTGGRLKLVVEGITFEESGERFVALYGGLRLARRTWSGDLGFAAANDGDEIVVLPVPLGGLSARF